MKLKDATSPAITDITEQEKNVAEPERILIEDAPTQISLLMENFRV